MLLMLRRWLSRFAFPLEVLLSLRLVLLPLDVVLPSPLLSRRLDVLCEVFVRDDVGLRV